MTSGKITFVKCYYSNYECITVVDPMAILAVAHKMPHLATSVKVPYDKFVDVIDIDAERILCFRDKWRNMFWQTILGTCVIS
jgi:hypothetical protein